MKRETGEGKKMLPKFREGQVVWYNSVMAGGLVRARVVSRYADKKGWRYTVQWSEKKSAGVPESALRAA